MSVEDLWDFLLEDFKIVNLSVIVDKAGEVEGVNVFYKPFGSSEEVPEAQTQVPSKKQTIEIPSIVKGCIKK